MKRVSFVFLFILFSCIGFSQSYIPDKRIDERIKKKVKRKFKRKLDCSSRKKKIEVLNVYWMTLDNRTNTSKEFIVTKELIMKNLVFNRKKHWGKWYYNSEGGIVYTTDRSTINEFHCFYNNYCDLQSLFIYGINLINVVEKMDIEYIFRISNIVGGNSDFFLVSRNENIFVLKDNTVNINKPDFNILTLMEYKPKCCYPPLFEVPRSANVP